MLDATQRVSVAEAARKVSGWMIGVIAAKGPVK